MIAIIDYNAGNIASVTNALDRFGVKYIVTRDAQTILSADKVIFPGQGRAGSAMADLRAKGLDRVIKQIKSPFLGICLGMQLLLPFSEEDSTDCLGIIPGRVKRFPEGVKIPQIGWNTVTQTRKDPLCNGVPDTAYAYFVNSYFVDTEADYIIGASQYGLTRYASIVKKDNFYGTQFHPEKSATIGLQILKNFCAPLIIPAIDIIGGKCVRLYNGDFSKQTTYGNDPISQAKLFADQGAQYIHMIDLEGAKNGAPANSDIIIAAAKALPVPVQVGGGIRTLEQAKKYLDNDISRIILGTPALTDINFVKSLVSEYGPDRIIVSIDAKDGLVAIKGWQETTTQKVSDVLEKLSSIGLTTIIYTDIQSDGALKGPNFKSISQVLAKPFKVIIAGGVTTVEDAKKLNDMSAYGVIIGKALYEGLFDLPGAFGKIPENQVMLSVKPASNVTKRVIACMDIAGGRVVKGTNFLNLRDAGDPVELGKLYSDSGVDELAFLDINATVENRPNLRELVKRISKKINIPFTVGGGIKTIEDIKNLLMAGADKVSIGSAAVTNPNFVSQAAKEFGSQCIVISVDPKRRPDGTWEIYIKGGRETTGIDAIEFCKDMERRGAGELLINSLDRDGTGEGYDLELLQAISSAISIPIIASSGAGTKDHFVEGLTTGQADAVLAATLFHYQKMTVPELKKYLASKNISVRL